MEKQIKAPKKLGGSDLAAQLILTGKCIVMKRHRRILKRIIVDFALENKHGGGTWGKEETYRGVQIKIETLFPPKSAGVWAVDIIDKNKETFSYVLKGPISKAETREHLSTYLKAKKLRPVISEFLPKFYGVYYGWQVAERLFGLENRGWKNKLEPRLENDEIFRDKYAKAIFNLYYLTASNDLKFCDVPQFVEPFDIGNYIVNSETAEITLIEFGNLEVCEKSSPNQKIAYELMRTLTVLQQWEESGQYIESAPLKEGSTQDEVTEWLKLGPISTTIPCKKIDLIFQVFKHVLNKISHEDLKIPEAIFESDFIKSIQENQIEKFARAISDDVFIIKETNFKFEGISVPGYYCD